LFPVSLRAKLRQMSSNVTSMIFELGGSDRFIRGLERFVVGFDWRFRIHDDQAIVREPDDHIGPRASVFGSNRLLLTEVAITNHTRKLDNAAKLHLTPPPTHHRAAKRVHKLGRFDLELPL